MRKASEIAMVESKSRKSSGLVMGARTMGVSEEEEEEELLARMMLWIGPAETVHRKWLTAPKR